MITILLAEASTKLTVERHLSYEELASLLDGTGSGIDRQFGACHLESCQRCAAGLDAIRYLMKEELSLDEDLILRGLGNGKTSVFRKTTVWSF